MYFAIVLVTLVVVAVCVMLRATLIVFFGLILAGLIALTVVVWARFGFLWGQIMCVLTIGFAAIGLFVWSASRARSKRASSHRDGD